MRSSAGVAGRDFEPPLTHGTTAVQCLLSELTSGSIGGGGGCQGGPDPFGVPSFVSSDNKHWTAVVPCVNGGSKSRPATPAEDRMLNK